MKKLSTIVLMFFPSLIFGQSRVEVNGQVKDSETGESLHNSHVYLNSHYGTLTDEQGFFNLEIPVEYGNGTLHISYLGYETFTIQVSKLEDEFLKVNLIPGVTWLDNVIVQADPWDDFRDIIMEISVMYDSKREFYAAVFNEMQRMEIENQDDQDVGKALVDSEERNEGGMLPGIIAFCIAALGLVFMARPFLRFVNKEKS
jgi:hypothetical protein